MLDLGLPGWPGITYSIGMLKPFLQFKQWDVTLSIRIGVSPDPNQFKTIIIFALSHASSKPSHNIVEVELTQELQTSPA